MQYLLKRYHSIRPVQVGGFNLGPVSVPVSPEHPANTGVQSDPSGRLQVLLQQNSPADQLVTTTQLYIAELS